MAETSGFFNSLTGDRKYYISFLAEYFSSFVGNGVFFGGEYLKVVPYGGNMDVNVQIGKAWINGYYYANKDAAKTITIETANATNPRIDLIVLKLNLNTAGRNISAVVKTGTASATPVAPVLQRDDAIYELKLAEVRVNAGVTEILVANITDYRLDSESCGIVTNFVPNDFTLDSIFDQYTDELALREAAWDVEVGNMGAEFDAQLSTQQSGYSTAIGNFNTWFADAQFDISNLQKFDFDNLIYANGYTFKAEKTSTSPVTWVETLRVTATSALYATRTSIKTTNGWNVIVTCSALGINNAMLYVKDENGIWEAKIGLAQYLTNLVTNGNFANGVTGWITTNIGTPTTVNNVCAFTATVTQGNLGLQPAYIEDHKYYFKLDVKLTTGGTFLDVQYKDDTWHTNLFKSVNTTDWQTIRGMFTSAADVVVGSGRFSVVDTRTSGWDAVQVKSVLCVDLTAAYGAGNEPTAAQMDAILAEHFANGWFDGTVLYAKAA